MKKLTIKIFLFISLFSLFIISTPFTVQAAKWVTVTVTEKIPGANCDDGTTKEKTVNGKKINSTTYKCTIEPWFGTVVKVMGKMIQYFVFLASLWGVLFIVINGIMYSMWWADQGLKDESKKIIVQTLIVLALLFLSWVILNLIAPWIWIL